MNDRTGLENPNSVIQMKEWLSGKGIEAESLDKKAVKEMLSSVDEEASVSKYRAKQKAVCADGRARGMFAFYGANRIGRWAGRIIQLQNLPQNHMDDLEEARNLVRDGNFEALELIYDNIPNVLSELVRTAVFSLESSGALMCLRRARISTAVRHLGCLASRSRSTV